MKKIIGAACNERQKSVNLKKKGEGRRAMRKRMTVIAALMLCSTAMTPALAQNCTSSTRCAELGYKKSASDCDGMESLVCPFDSSKYFCVEAEDSAARAAPGSILYSDGTVSDSSDSVIPTKTPIGVVAYVDESRRFAVALAETTAEWGHYGYDGSGYDVSCLTNYDDVSSAQTDFNGATNTQCLINDSQSHPAAEYCNNYKPVSSGKGSSGWYLPAVGELYEMYFNYRAINLSLQKLSKTQLSGDWYWSSSEYDSKIAWLVNPSDGDWGHSYKNGVNNYSCRVRCVLAF